MDKILHFAWLAIPVVLMFGASVFVHELGHFLVALRRRMRIEAFAIGFGPKIWGRVKNGIEYSVRWIPAGGFVKLPQMFTSDAIEGSSAYPEEPVPPASPASKILVALAGPAMNLVFAYLVAQVIYFVGLPVLVNPSIIGKVNPDSPEGQLGIREGDRIVEFNGQPVRSWEEVNMAVVVARSNTFTAVLDRNGVRTPYTLTAKASPEIGLKWLNLDPYEHPIVGAVESGMPAESAGLLKGDRFLTFDGVPVISQEHLIQLVSKREGQLSKVVVSRDQKQVALEVTPRYDPKTKRGRMGIVFAGGVYEVMKPGPTPWVQFKQVWDRTVSTLGALLHSKETGVKASDLSGPVGILANMAVEANTDYRRALSFLVLLNVSLAILNLLPIPVLDGGHVVMAVIEWIRRRPVSLKFVQYAYTGCAVLLISFMLYVTFFDLRRLPLFNALLQRGSQVVDPGTMTATNLSPAVPAPSPATGSAPSPTAAPSSAAPSSAAPKPASGAGR
jgi:regulator of sigma E protease